MAADPEKTVTVTVDENGRIVIHATHTEMYPEKPSILGIETSSGQDDEKFLRRLKETSMSWSPPRADPKIAPGAGKPETATIILTAGGRVAAGTIVVKVDCSGTIFPVAVPVSENGKGTGSIKAKDLPKQ